MEEIKNLEQLENSSGVENVGEQNSQGEKVQSNPENSSSNLGKFKDPANLLSAYNNLEKEFTKKCQKLAELSKTNEQLLSKNQSDTTTILSQEENKTTDWTTYAKDFVKENPEAKKYANEIFEIVKSDKNLASSPNCLEYALAICESNHKVDTESLLSDPQFLSEHVYSNNEIKEKIINEYLLSLKTGTQMPKFISGTTQHVNVTISEKKPKTIKDASNILRKLLNT